MRVANLPQNMSQDAVCSLNEFLNSKKFKNNYLKQSIIHPHKPEKRPLKVADPSLPSRSRGQRHGRIMDYMWVGNEGYVV